MQKSSPRTIPTDDSEYSNGLDKHYLKEKFLKYYKGYKGNATKASASTKISYRTYIQWKHDDEVFKENLSNIDSYFVEQAQETLLKMVMLKKDVEINKLQLDAIKYFLDRKGKGKGYGAIVEEKDTNVTVNIIDNQETDSKGEIESPRKEDGL